MTRQFLEDDMRRTERRLREAERHISRQKAIVQRFETLGDAGEAQLARGRLGKLRQELELAKEALQRQQTWRQPTIRPLNRR